MRLRKTVAWQLTTVQRQNSENFPFIGLIRSNDQVSKAPPVQDLLLICNRIFFFTFPPFLIEFASRVARLPLGCHHHRCLIYFCSYCKWTQPSLCRMLTFVINKNQNLSDLGGDLLKTIQTFES